MSPPHITNLTPQSNADKTMKGGYQILSLLSSLHSTNLECASDHGCGINNNNNYDNGENNNNNNDKNNYCSCCYYKECKEMQIEVLSSLVSLMKEWVAEGVKVSFLLFLLLISIIENNCNHNNNNNKNNNNRNKKTIP